MFMKKLLVVVALFSLFCVPSLAQDFPKAEVFGAYSLAKVSGDAGDVLDAFDSEVGSYGSTSTWLKGGFMGSVTVNINEYFGVEANFAYHRGTIAELNADIEGETVDAKGKADSFTFMAGPKFAYRGQETFTPFGHFLIGLDSVKLSGECTGTLCEELPSELDIFDMPGRDSALAFAVGGGFDLNVNDSVAIRPIEFDYIFSNHGEGDYDFTVNYITLSFGVVFKVGQ
jgi:opacity protein-like surface antigen